MQYELVWVTTKDGLDLYGLLTPEKNKRALINIHGTASNFYEEEFIANFSAELPKIGVSVLSVNNRGAYVLEAYQDSGAAVEKFEDCIIDIDAWIEFALKKGFKEIILSGHSLGSEKVVYYMENGKYKDKVIGVILLGPADSYGSHRMLEGKPNIEVKKRVDSLLKESVSLIKQGMGETLLNRYAYGSHDGIMPKTAESFVNFLGSKSRVLSGLPFVTGKLENYSKIKCPILVVIGDESEYTGLSVDDALKLMKKENKLTETYKIKNCNHDFEDKEADLTNIVASFVKKLK